MIRVIDETDSVELRPTQAEAIELAIAQARADGGGTITLHAKGCRLLEEDGECTCTPYEFEVEGAQ